MLTKEDVGNVLRRIRLAAGMTQKEVAEKIGRTQQVIGHWETGYAQPDANTLFVLCDIYGTTADDAFGFKRKHELSKEEHEALKKYRTFSDEEKGAINTLFNYISSLHDRPKGESISVQLPILRFSPAEDATIELPKALHAASAGTGQFANDDTAVQTEVRLTGTTRQADYLLPITGDSMEPDYPNGCTVAVKSQSTIAIGEVGVFAYNSELYIKRRGRKGLESLNPNYETIKVTDFDALRCLGLVLGVVG